MYTSNYLQWTRGQMFRCGQVKMAVTPMVENKKKLFERGVFSEACQKDDPKYMCREPMGSSVYIGTHTRPDITFVVNILNDSVKTPVQAHLCTASYVPRYLVGSTGHG